VSRMLAEDAGALWERKASIIDGTACLPAPTQARVRRVGTGGSGPGEWSDPLHFSTPGVRPPRRRSAPPPDDAGSPAGSPQESPARGRRASRRRGKQGGSGEEEESSPGAARHRKQDSRIGA
jgi:hypothetical protein